MQYFVVMPDGRKIGPADIAALNQWIIDKHIGQTTLIESTPDGVQTTADQIPGLIFPPDPAAPVEPDPAVTPVEPSVILTSVPAQYYVVLPDGQKFGPADLTTLNQWVGEKRILRTTLLELTTNGQQVTADKIPELTFPEEAPAPIDPALGTAAIPPAGTTPQPKHYFVIAPGGQKFGPADLPTLNGWATEGRITAFTELEDSSNGMRLSANNVPGLMLGTALQMPTAPGEPLRPGQPGPASPYSQPPSAYPRNFNDNRSGDGQSEGIWGIVLSIIGVPCCGLLSLIGLFLAYTSKNKGAEIGKTAVVVAWICVALAILASVATFSNYRRMMH